MNAKPNMIVGIVLLAAAAAFAGSASAQTPNPGNSASQSVHYRDLNLSTAEGVQTLYRRIRLAALAGCEQIAASPPYIFEGCTRTAITAAVRAVNNADLTAMHNGKRPNPVIAAR
jgi:UrcA family protein